MTEFIYRKVHLTLLPTQNGQSRVVHREAPDGSVISLGISTRSELFPNRKSETLAYYVLNFVGLRFKFYRDRSAYSHNLGDPDLMFKAFVSVDGSINIWSEGDASLIYNLKESQPYVLAPAYFAHLKIG